MSVLKSSKVLYAEARSIPAKSHTSEKQYPNSALSASGKIDVIRLLALFLMGLFLFTVAALCFAPWQQFVRGSGRVIAFTPLERQQEIEAPIAGRVVKWHVQEGAQVKSGDLLAEIADNDPSILSRLREERAAIKSQVSAILLSINRAEDEISSLEDKRNSADDNAKLKVEMGGDRQEAASRAVDAARASLRTSQLNYSRQKELFDKGLASRRDLELAQLERQTAQVTLDRAKASFRASETEVKALSASQSEVFSTNLAKIESTKSSLQKLKAEKSKSDAELAKVEVRLARQEQMKVYAPREGSIFRILAAEGTEMVKAGDPLIVLVPDTVARAVEVYVDGNDAPLVDQGRQVRIQFEGWPAVQFVGWPSAAVGTFGGIVSFVDSHDDGTGKFRVVVVQDPNDEPWPKARFLRQGVRANGWILLNQVKLGFELWRNFNGFPPVISQPELAKGAKK